MSEVENLEKQLRAAGLSDKAVRNVLKLYKVERFDGKKSFCLRVQAYKSSFPLVFPSSPTNR